MQVGFNSYSQSVPSVKVAAQNTKAVSETEEEQQLEQAQQPECDKVEISGSKEESAKVSKGNPALVEQLKADLQNRQAQLFDMVNKTLSKQGVNVTMGQGVWRVLAEGNFQVDAETKAAAQEAISEDGYWGVKKTSERLLNFAKALVGDDPSRAEEMREAVIKGFKAAGIEWGGELPGICHETYDATMKLFDEWASGGKAEEAGSTEGKEDGSEQGD